MLIIEKNVIRDCKCFSVVWCSRHRAIDLEDPGSTNWKGKINRLCTHHIAVPRLYECRNDK